MLAVHEETRANQHGGVSENDAEDNQPYPGLFSQDTMPAIIESLVIDDVASDSENQTGQGQADHRKESHGHRRQRSSKSSQGKVMTSQEFEMYRQSKMMHQEEFDDSESDGYQDEEDFSYVEDMKRKEAAFQHRQRQQAYIAEQRVNRRKVSGGGSSENDDARPVVDALNGLDTSVTAWLSTNTSPQLDLAKPKAGQTARTAQDDDEDVPIAILAKARGQKNGQEAYRARSPQNTLHPSVRPQTRAHTRVPPRHLATPSPQPHTHLRPFTPSPTQTSMGHHHGRSLGMNNASQVSLVRPQIRRPHTSGGLVSQIGTLECPSPWNKPRLDKDPFGMPANPPRFYGRETPAPQQYPMMMMGGVPMSQQYTTQQFQGGAYYGAAPMNWGQFNQQGQQVGVNGYRMY